MATRQFDLFMNAVARVPNEEVTKSIGRELRAIYNLTNAPKAQQALDRYSPAHPKLADGLIFNIPDFFSLFALTKNHPFRMSTSNHH